MGRKVRMENKTRSARGGGKRGAGEVKEQTVQSEKLSEMEGGGKG